MNSPDAERTTGPVGSSGADVEGARERFTAAIANANEAGRALDIVGGETKRFYGRRVEGDRLETRAYCGIVEYEAAELVVTVRAGTALRDVEQTLAAENQMFAFEPPCFGNAGTIGGMVATGLSGPRRPYAGSVRDAVLGLSAMAANGEALSFGGQVMKNVAGYDVARLMTGAMGTLGLLLAVSLRVAPRPQLERTLVWSLGQTEAHERMIAVARRPYPVSGMAYDGDLLRVRMSGHADAVGEAELELSPDTTDSTAYWRELSDQTLPFFQTREPLWRLSVLPATAPLDLDGQWLWDWGGACRWLKSNEASTRVHAVTDTVGGHATLFRSDTNDTPFTPLNDINLRIHRRLKSKFDPQGIFNPGRMYAEL